MRQSLRTFISREAGSNDQDCLSLLRDLAPFIYIERGYDVDELRELHANDGGSEYVSPDWPDVPVPEPLRCIVIRPYSRTGHQGSPYELVTGVAGHLRDVLNDAVLEPNFAVIGMAYIEPAHSENWNKAAYRWKISLSNPLVHAALAGRTAPTKESRQDSRLKACESYGLVMPTSSLGRLPDGVGDVADREGVTRQAFSTDVKAALKRRESAIREGRIVHRS